MRGRRPELNTFEGQFENFLKRIEVSGGCWNWTGPTTPYGHHKWFGKLWVAHRLAYHLFIGDFDPTLDVCHTCDTPRCVLPTHLFLGTANDNIQDMLRKGRHRGLKGVENHKAKLNEALVREIRNTYAQGGTSFPKLASQYGVAMSTIATLVTRKTWSHIV